MADEARVSYPLIPVRRWWQLREQFKQALPSVVSASYVATVLEMREHSATGNIIPSLRQFRIIDEAGNPTQRAREWRDDASYPKVCREIRDEVYPPELIAAQPGPTVDRRAVQWWFARRLGVGESASRKMSTVYEVLSEADPSRAKPGGGDSSTAEAVAPIPEEVRPAQAARHGAARTAPFDGGRSGAVVVHQTPPSLHVAIQVHIPPEATADQIEQIFASMAKHLYRLTS